jgi:hypothetical protein
MRVSAILLCLVAAAASAGAGENGERLNAKLVNMPENSWLRLEPPKSATSRAYSGCCFGGGLFWHWGGAHRSYMGNEVDLYDPVRNEWKSSEKEWPDETNLKLMAGVKAPRDPVSPKLRPWPGHSYQQVCYVPERKAFFMVNRGHTWEFSPETMEWTCLAGPASKGKKTSPRCQGAQSHHVIYDPSLKAPVLIMTTGPFGTFVYDYAKMEWRERKNAPMRWAELYSTYADSKKLHVVSGNKKHGMWTYDAAKEEWKKLEGVPERLLGTQALAYDSTSDVVLAAAPNKGKAPLELFVMDPETMKWSEQKPANAGPSSGGLWAPMWYDADHQVFLYLNFESRGPDFKGGKTTTWAYRHKKAGK